MSFERLLLAALLILLTAAPANAAWPHQHGGGPSGSPTGTATIQSFDGSGLGVSNRTGQWTSDQRLVDAHGGGTLPVGGTYYRYGGNDYCGEFTDDAYYTFCGIAIYTTTDFSNKGWTFQGFLMDPADSHLAICEDVGQFPDFCGYRAKMLYNAANNNYVMWVMSYRHQAMIYFCPTPTGGATPTSYGTECVYQNTVFANGGFGITFEDMSTFVDPQTGAGYYIDIGQVRQMTADFTAFSSTSAAITTHAAEEAPSMFYYNGTYYLLYGTLCPDCSAGSVHTYYQKASSPLGPWDGSTETEFSTNNTCMSQNGISTIVNTAGGLVALYEADQWDSGTNESKHIRYYEPLTFTGNAINPLTCAATKTLSGVVTAPSPTKPAGSDQSSWPNGQFGPTGIFSNTTYGGVTDMLQTFVPTNSGTLSAASLDISKTQWGWINGVCCWGSAAVPPAPVIVKIVTVDGSHNPVATLSSVTLQPSDVTWGIVPYKLTGLATAVVGGTEYGIEVSSHIGNNEGAYATGIAHNNPYPAGVFRVSSDNGSSWTTQAGYALLFNTFGP